MTDSTEDCGTGTKSNEKDTECGIPQVLNHIYFTYIPAVGAVSHTAFAVHILNRPILQSLFPRWHYGVANSLLFNSHLGIGLYIYNRPCLLAASQAQRITWSVYGSAMFNFGSVLLFSIGKQLLVEDKLIGTLYAMAASLCFLVVGKHFFQYMDSRQF